MKPIVRSKAEIRRSIKRIHARITDALENKRLSAYEYLALSNSVNALAHDFRQMSEIMSDTSR